MTPSLGLVRCSRPLSYIVENPEDVCVDSNTYGMWPSGLGSYRWDGVILQSYYGASGESELNAAELLLHAVPEQLNPVVYIYVNWPTIRTNEFIEGWNLPYNSAVDGVTLSFAYYTWLAQAARERLGEAHLVRVIPVGAVLAELDRRFRQGERPGFTKADDLYRDADHMNKVGRYVAGLTFLAVTCDFDVRLLGEPPDYYNVFSSDNDASINLEFADYLQEVVYQVVRSRPFADSSLPNAERVEVQQDGPQFIFKSHLGYDYTVLESSDLKTWSVRLLEKPGDGNRWHLIGEGPQKFFKLLRSE